jgi:hypothetical protein
MPLKKELRFINPNPTRLLELRNLPGEGRSAPPIVKPKFDKGEIDFFLLQILNPWAKLGIVTEPF